MGSFIFNSTHYYRASARQFVGASVWVNGHYLLKKLTIFTACLILRLLENLWFHIASQLGNVLSFRYLNVLNRVFEEPLATGKEP